MLRTFVAAAAATLLGSSAPGQAPRAGVPERLDWTIEAPDEAAARETVQFTLGYSTPGGRSVWSQSLAPDALQGLDAGAARAAEPRPVRFSLVRPAGRIDCDGTAGRGRGSGQCRFDPDEGFAAGLEQRGVATSSRSELYQMALARGGLDLVDELARQEYATPSPDDLVQAGIHGVDAAYVREMSDAGYRLGALDGLAQMRIHGIGADYVRALASAGYRPDPDLLLQLRIHGIGPDYVRDLAAAAGTRFSAEDLVALKIHGVTPEFVRALQALGYDALDAGDLTQLRIHGVTPDFVRHTLAAAPSRPSASELVGLKLRGGR